jgi:HEAT repeat protein
MPPFARDIACCLLVACAAAAPVHADPTVTADTRRTAVAWLTETINDTETLPVAMAGLRSTNDADLLPVFVTLTEHPEREVRLMATAMIAEIAGDKAAPALKDRLENDPSMVIRGEALIHLADMNAVSDATLIEATTMPDQGVKVIAARALARRGKADRAKALLIRMAESRDPDTEVFARMSLLDLGDTDQIPHLKKIILDEQTPSDLLIRMLNQIRDEKIDKALPVARYLAKPPRLLPVRLRAYWAVAELAENPGPELADAIRQSDSMMLQLNLLRLLADRDGTDGFLREFAGRNDSIAVAARFELARRTGPQKLQAAVAELIDEEHPVVIDYVIHRFRQDLRDDRSKAAEQYVQPLLAYLDSLDLPRSRMTGAHDRGAAIVELLANHGSRRVVAGLREMLAGTRNSARRQLIAGALYRSENPIAADLVRPLLDSAYPELYTYAALVLARHGQADAIPVLKRLQENADINRSDVLVLANWYLIKLSGMTAPSVDAIVKGIK